MTFGVKLGVSEWDAVTFVRNITEDQTPPYVVPDSAYIAFAELANEHFSDHVPVDYLIGNSYANTSPFKTVGGQQHYVCTAANGFSPAPTLITDVLYRAASGYSAASDIAYMAILPFSPVNRFIVTPNLLDSPSERVLRDEYLNELQHYGAGSYSLSRDPSTGLPAIDIYPIPAGDGLPIFVRYQGQHAITLDASSNFVIPTIPEHMKRQWALLLYAMVLEEEGERLIRVKMAKSGITEVQSDPRLMEMKINRIRDDALRSLGAEVGQISVSI